MLLQTQTTNNLFPTSTHVKNLAISSSNPQALYARILRPYILDLKDINPTHADYGLWNRSDIGHKLHLNVRPEDVHYVSAYLQEMRINHKYLSGGDVRQGKIFTLYPGSKRMADQLARELSADLNDLLCRPVCREEIEYASNVVGRFTERGLRFHKDGEGVLRGLPLLFSDLDTLEEGRVGIDTNDPRWKRQAFERSFSVLAETYGPYFYGDGFSFSEG